MALDDVYEKIARKLCEIRGEDPDLPVLVFGTTVETTRLEVVKKEVARHMQLQDAIRLTMN